MTPELPEADWTAAFIGELGTLRITPETFLNAFAHLLLSVGDVDGKMMVVPDRAVQPSKQDVISVIREGIVIVLEEVSALQPLKQEFRFTVPLMVKVGNEASFSQPSKQDVISTLFEEFVSWMAGGVVSFLQP